ncbi:hypothetical protein ACFV9C_42335 [Kribbella sp. NPDC059898]|uniref:hypothetical protein n=1 Tax=Kribbella sp. NPDC059898 TaxID=3346995 RepID=UPI00364E751A
MNIATTTPAEIDTKLRDLLNDLAAGNKAVDRAQVAIHHAAGDSTDRTGRWGMSAGAARDKADEIAQMDGDSYAKDRAQEALAGLRKQLGMVAEIAHQVDQLEAEFTARGGWTRAYLAVTNGRGHIHSTKWCSTCNNGQSLTAFYWFAELSGSNQAEIIRQAGSDACTVCYPDAPVEDLRRPRSLFTPDEVQVQHDLAIQREQRAAKSAAAAAKAITNPDGTPLLDEDNRPIKTERGAEIAAVAALVDDEWYEFRHLQAEGWRAYVGRAVAALAAKRGIDESEVRAALDDKAQKKLRRLRKEAAALGA